jgi:hypothetical protein
MQCAAGSRLRGVTEEHNALQVSASGLLQWNWNAVCCRHQPEADCSGTGTQCAAGIRLRGGATATRRMYFKV